MSRVVCILVLVFVYGCAPYPNLPYYQLDDAIANAKTPEEKAYHKKRQRAIEDTAIKATRFLGQLSLCRSAAGCQTQCFFSGPVPSDVLNPKPEDIDDIEKLVRWYGYVRPPTCGFVLKGM